VYNFSKTNKECYFSQLAKNKIPTGIGNYKLTKFSSTTTKSLDYFSPFNQGEIRFK